MTVSAPLVRHYWDTPACVDVAWGERILLRGSVLGGWGCGLPLLKGRWLLPLMCFCMALECGLEDEGLG